MNLHKLIADKVGGVWEAVNAYRADYPMENILAADRAKLLGSGEEEVPAEFVKPQPLILTDQHLVYGNWKLSIFDIVKLEVGLTKRTFGISQLVTIETRAGDQATFKMHHSPDWYNQEEITTEVFNPELKWSWIRFFIRWILIFAILGIVVLREMGHI
ncbi:hypothetical protein [Pontibacter sp. G13]|uniref:hypothetical protein n=1 Tax=Pontibacter sp. G13 TaxID=3074898 RepID=UPI00288B310D|nr:hypothetical protein [Pontibacter sp. G13]WNJ18416.1 hypothetical protein RJD25_26475 [Pontibacter sp. G13]